MKESRICVNTQGKICPLNNKICSLKDCSWCVEVEINDEKTERCMIVDLYMRVLVENLCSDSAITE